MIFCYMFDDVQDRRMRNIFSIYIDQNQHSTLKMIIESTYKSTLIFQFPRSNKLTRLNSDSNQTIKSEKYSSILKSM